MMPRPFTEDDRRRLEAAVDALNAELARVVEECGDQAEVRGHVNYSVDEPRCSVVITVTTGVVRIGGERF